MTAEVRSQQKANHLQLLPLLGIVFVQKGVEIQIKRNFFLLCGVNNKRKFQDYEATTSCAARPSHFHVCVGVF